MPHYSWIFVDRASQQTFRIRCGDPSWEIDEQGRLQRARCRYQITAEDGTSFAFLLQIGGGVLEGHGVSSPQELIRFIQARAADIVEGVIHRGIRTDQEVVWEPDGVSIGG